MNAAKASVAVKNALVHAGPATPFRHCVVRARKLWHLAPKKSSIFGILFFGSILLIIINLLRLQFDITL